MDGLMVVVGVVFACFDEKTVETGGEFWVDAGGTAPVVLDPSRFPLMVLAINSPATRAEMAV